jgi:predicted outer membrane repeat protein
LNTISNNSLTGNSANRGGAIYSNKGTVTNNTITNNTTSLTGSLYMNEGIALGNNLSGNNAANGGGIYGYKATLTGNTVENNTANIGGGILSTESTVRGNTLEENAAQSDGGGLWAQGGTITHNQIVQNQVPSYGRGSGAYLEAETNFTYNNVTANTASGGTVGGVTVVGPSTLQYNNLYSNLPYDVEISSGEDVTGTLNYWGATACVSIPGHIYDGNDLPGLGHISYAPSLYSLVPVAQMPTPVGLTLSGDDTAVDLSWTALQPLPNVGCRPPGYTGPGIGYKVFYGVGACPPYNGTGLPQGSSPIDVGEATSVQLTDLGAPATYFVVAAYDYLERLSGYSNVVVKPSSASNLYLPALKK